MTEQQLTPAEIRLAQYAERGTWTTATYNDGTEKALHEIAVGLKTEVDRLRDALSKEERLHGDTIDDRDRFHDMADKLAYAVAPEEVIGEHSSMNCPWENALDLITPEAKVDELRARVTELEAELKKYVGAEPTVADEVAYLSACYQAVGALQLPEKLKVDSISGDYRNGYIHALADMRTTLQAPERKTYPPALPWAQLMDDEDLQEFLGDLIDCLNTTPATTRDVLAEVEKTCGSWRAIAEAQHAHNTAAGPNVEAEDGQ